jgi:hypothetical protein
MFILILILLSLPSLLLTIDLIKFLIKGKRFYDNGLVRVLEFTVMLVLPILYLWILDENTNDCCSDSATFSPDHKLTIYTLIAICVVVYFYSSYKEKLVSPITEVLTNSVLLFGFVFNILIGIQVGDMLWLIGNIPIGILFLFRLIENHKAFLEFTQTDSFEATNFNMGLPKCGYGAH